jgi:hypothetical protein
LTHIEQERLKFVPHPRRKIFFISQSLICTTTRDKISIFVEAPMAYGAITFCFMCGKAIMPNLYSNINFLTNILLHSAIRPQQQLNYMCYKESKVLSMKRVTNYILILKFVNISSFLIYIYQYLMQHIKDYKNSNVLKNQMFYFT